MLLESACIPIPSEITMPVAGLLASEHHLSLVPVIAVGVVANLAGSLLSYAVGRGEGRSLLLKYGRYILIKPHDIERADDWFARYGPPAVFFARVKGSRTGAVGRQLRRPRCHRLDAVGEALRAIQPLEVATHRVNGDAECGGHLLVGTALGCQLQDLLLAVGGPDYGHLIRQSARLCARGGARAWRSRGRVRRWGWRLSRTGGIRG